ncbi:hypothetical protein [Photobacterium leiognathi]|uniref:hypothetical protein n=1 Tax=Photobacterium leiognathi TaxID=553611 RepID=UPI002980F172|nr:hypothetical protein [Photobacterium leiognathi]
MARYRVGNSFLSADEYEEHNIGMWATGLFIVSALFTGVYIYKLVSPLEIYKWLKFSAIGLSSITVGSIFAFFAAWIRQAFFIGVGLSIVGLICSIIWEHL